MKKMILILLLISKKLYDYIDEKYKIEDYDLEKRNENIEKLDSDKKYKENENSLFCQFEVPFNLLEKGIYLISIDMNLDIAMDNLVKREKEKEEKSKMGIELSSESSEEEESEKENENEDEKEKEKNKKYDPFEDMTKQERKKSKINKKRRENKKFTKKKK